jgi:hypothetical protein
MVCTVVLGFAAFSFAGIPDLDNSTAVTAATERVSVFCLPDASGARFDAAKTIGSPVLVDATVTVTLLDDTADPPGPQPVFNYPFEDIWMETTDGGLLKCPGGTTADFSTNINGVTVFAAAMFAYGHSDPTLVPPEAAVVYINGSPLVGSNMDILFNSADMDENQVVNLTDLVYFAAYIGTSGLPYDYEADYYYDGTINLSDLVFFAGGIGAACPTSP